jgi:pyrimidine-nucleoside phosphorylase
MIPVRMYDIIHKKRHGEKLSEDEIKYFVLEYTKGNIPDYQASALLIAIAINSMDKEETVNLTKWMVNSGEVLNLDSIPGKKTDKHSTGGVGDKTTLICAMIVAALDVPVAKMSGRGLGHTGGTIDKLESIPGFRTSLSRQEFIDLVKKNRIAICGQSESLAPADKLLYSLRDQTATVDSIPLIASSIMSKKIAAGSDCIVLDVKVGKGAFMKTIEEARVLADLMCEIGLSMSKKTVSVISYMNEPLGYAIGNSLEVIESIETLKGNGPEDLYSISIKLASNMVSLAKDIEYEEAEKLCKEVLEKGKALEKFREFVRSQNGDERVVEDYSVFKQAKRVFEYKAERSGMIKSIDSYRIGNAACLLGAGRTVKDGVIDPSAGIVLTRKSGDRVKKGECLAKLYTDFDSIDNVLDILNNAWEFEEGV